MNKLEEICSRFYVKHASSLRGGGEEKENTQNSENLDYSGLYSKFCKYKDKVLRDTSLENEFNLYVEPLVHSHHSLTKSKHEVFELDFDIRTKFLGPHDDVELKVLLLTGAVGIGKSLFCRRLQREILFGWEGPPYMNEGQWFAIYIPLS